MLLEADKIINFCGEEKETHSLRCFGFPKKEADQPIRGFTDFLLPTIDHKDIDDAI